MPKIELAEGEAELVIQCMRNVINEQRLKAIAGPANVIPGLAKMLEGLEDKIKAQLNLGD